MNSLFIINESFTNGYKSEILDIICVLVILSGIFVIISKNAIISLLFLIGLFAGISSYLLIIGLSFLGLAYLVVYIGAVSKSKNIAALVKIQLYRVLLIIIKIFQKEIAHLLLFIYSGCTIITNTIQRHWGKQTRALLNYRGICKTLTIHKVSFYSPLNISVISNAQRFYSTNLSSQCTYTENDEDFFKWFVGFSDGESNFTIVLHKDQNGDILKGSAIFRFTIELHIDDKEVLNYIKSRLNIGTEVAVYGNSCKFTVVHKKDIYVLISIFDKFNLNTTKYLDYLEFKKAFILYNESARKLEADKIAVMNQLLNLKNGMNNNRTNFNFPSNHKIVISDYWLLGLIEGEGSFTLERANFRASFMVALTQIQLPVLEKIKEFLESNLLFDKYSMFKLKNSSSISIGISNTDRENSKPLVRLTIRNTSLLINYFIPFLNNMKFQTKKGKDFEDFKIICTALYNGTHRSDDIKSLILDLSYTMNNYRLSTNSDPKKVSDFTKDKLNKIINAEPVVIHLSDGRQVNSITRKEVNTRLTNCVYEIINDKGEVTLTSTLNEAATILNVDFRTLKKSLDSDELSVNFTEKEEFAEIKGKKVRRVPVFFPKRVFNNP